MININKLTSSMLLTSAFFFTACGGGGSTTQSGNTSPVMHASFSDININMNSIARQFLFKVSDADGDDLNISIDLNDTSIFSLTQNWTNRVRQANYNDVNLSFMLTPEVNATGIVKVTMNVSDGQTSNSKSFNITVIDSNASFVSGGTWKGKIYNTIVSSDTNRTWLDRNLGASNACTSDTNTTCFGDYYQWGRSTDGHQESNSTIVNTQATSLTPTGGLFITGTDWTTADNNGSQRSANWGICPNGYSVPTQQELGAENILNGTDSYTKLKIPLAGYRNSSTGTLTRQGSMWSIWSSTPVSSGTARVAQSAGIYTQNRATAYSVRCIKD